MISVKPQALTKIDMQMAVGFPGGIPFPQNVPCPGRCKFCYEHDTPKLFPWIKVKYIPPFDDNLFVSYVSKTRNIYHLRKGGWEEKPACAVVQSGNRFYYFPKCDFFSLGLSTQQIELILKYGKPLLAYTTGLNADPDLVSYLVKKYPGKFALSLSIITLNPILRSQLMNPQLTLDNLRKICKVTTNSVYFLLFFNKSQAISDIESLNEYSLKNKNHFSVCKLYYSKVSDPLVKKLGAQADCNFGQLIDYLRKNTRKLGDLSHRITFLPDSPAFAWARKRELRFLLQVVDDDEGSAVFCTAGASHVIQRELKRAHVITVQSCFGGNIDFVLGMTAQGVIAGIRGLIAKDAYVRRVYIPENVFSISNKYDFNLKTQVFIQKAFHRVKVICIPVPLSIQRIELTLNECFDYYCFSNCFVSGV